MAKYNIKMSCGHEEVHNLTGKTDRIKWQIGRFEETGICRECFKKRKEEENKQMGLVLKARIPNQHPYNGNYTLYAEIFFLGDTQPHKDIIKEKGYRWDYIEGREMSWLKEIPLDDLESEIETIKNTFNNVKIDFSLDELRESKSYENAVYQIEEQKARDKDRLEALEELKKQKPESPDIIRDKRWNYKIYGRENYYSIYLDGDKINLSNEQADILRSYLREKEVYDNKVHDIKMR